MAERFWKTPTALTVWTLGTGLVGGLASMILTKRAEKMGWIKFDSSKVFFAILGASALNLYLASAIMGEK